MSTPACTIVQLTDTHIVTPGELVRGVVDTADNVRAVLEQIVGSGRNVDALLLSGDLTDDGDIRAYRRLRDLVEPAAAALDAEIIYAMGNHDVRESFRAGLFDDRGDPDRPHDTVHLLGSTRVITMDSTRPGRHEGWLDDDQLSWLRSELAHAAPAGCTVLVLHHPPLRSAIPPIDGLRLQHAARLGDILLGSDVKMIVCGHSHLTGSGSLAGIPVWVGPALSYRLDTFAPIGRHRGVFGFGFSRIDVVDGTVVATAVEATPSEPVYDVSESEILARLRDLARQGT